MSPGRAAATATGAARPALQPPAFGGATAVAFDTAFGQQYATLGAGQARGRTSSFTAAVPMR